MTEDSDPTCECGYPWGLSPKDFFGIPDGLVGHDDGCPAGGGKMVFFPGKRPFTEGLRSPFEQ